MAPYWWLLHLHWIPAAGTAGTAGTSKFKICSSVDFPLIAQQRTTTSQRFRLTDRMDKNPELCLPRAEVTSTNGTQVYTEDPCSKDSPSRVCRRRITNLESLIGVLSQDASALIFFLPLSDQA